MSGGPGPLAGRYRSVALDLDGTVYLEDEVVPAAPGTLRAVRELGVKLAFVTNNAMRPAAAVVEKLSGLGIKATVEEVLTSSQATVTLLGGEAALRGKGVLVVGGAGLREAMAGAGARLLEPAAWRDAEIVTAGLDPELTYEKARAAVLAIAAGARFVGSNPDPSLPTPEGPWPGAGAVLAFLSTASGRRPEIAGKPERAMFEAIAAALGPGPRLMVGDRVDTDLAGARALGWDTALVLTGVTRPRDLLDAAIVPDHVLADVGGLMDPPGPEVRVDGEDDGRLRALAERDGAKVGSLTVARDGDRARLEELRVEPEDRGHLVGTRLLLAAAARLREAGARRLDADLVRLCGDGQDDRGGRDSRDGGGDRDGRGRRGHPDERNDLGDLRAFLRRLGFEGGPELGRELAPATR
ncbi:MAG TPA: HAD-IIA family hydrolase [Actinomycetota bacterium]